MDGSNNGRSEVPKFISLKVCDELYDLVAKESDATGFPLIDVVVRRLAKSFKRPDLSFVPRKKIGRPRKLPA